ncbi:Avirulence (Avh) protein, partial [Phytophthora megakarya]
MARNNLFEKPAFTTWVKYVDDLNAKHPEKPSRMYPTLTKYFDDETLFKLTDDMKWSEKTKPFATKLEDDWLQAGLQSRKTPEKVLVGLGLGKTTDSLLENSLFSHWAKYTAAFNKRYPEEKATMIETLTKKFGDIEVTKMLHTAKSKKWTKTLATQLESAQMKMWLNNGKSTDDVFKLLQLDKYGNIYHFEDKVLLSAWVSYMNVFTKENPNKKDVLLSALGSRLTDRPLNQILNEAKTFPSMENTAIKIQTNKIQSYLASNESPNKVFELLALDEMGDGILGTPLFRTWMNYAKDFNKQNPNKQVSWFDTLRSENNWKGFQVIDKAMENPSTVSIGKTVQREWINTWLNNEKPPKVVFGLLDLNAAGKYTLTNPRFKTWTTYLDEFNQRYPSKTPTVIDGLRSNYDDMNLLAIFKAAKKNPTTAKLTTDLENALINK